MSSLIYLPEYEVSEQYFSDYKPSNLLYSKFCNIARLSPLQTKFFESYGPHPQITDYSNSTSSKDNYYSFAPVVDIDTRYGQNFNNFCYNKTSIYIFKQLDLTSITTGAKMFYGCTNLLKLNIYCNSLPTSALPQAFYNCSNLKDLSFFGTIKVDSNDLNFATCPNLSVESLLNILYAFEDNTNEVTPWTVYFGEDNLAKLTESQKAIATNKNIALA